MGPLKKWNGTLLSEWRVAWELSIESAVLFWAFKAKKGGGGGGGISYNDLHGKAPPEKLRISVVEVCEMDGKTVIKPVCKQAQ